MTVPTQRVSVVPAVATISQGIGRRAPTMLVVLAGCLSVIDLYLLGFRGHSLFRDAHIIRWTTGLEEIPIYAVWRIVHGLPLYSWPQQSLDNPSLYNWLFYYTFGQFARLTGASSLAIMILLCRLLSAAYLAVGAAGQWMLMRMALKEYRLRSSMLLAWAIVFCTWFGSGFVRWFAFSVRGDGAAVALSTWALVCVTATMQMSPHVDSGRRRALLLGASVLFFLGWSMKQTAVSFFMAVCLMQLWHRRWRELAYVAAPFALGILATFAVGGTTYLQNTVIAPSWGDASAGHAIAMVLRAIWPNLFMWLTPLVCLATLRPWRQQGRASSRAGPVLALIATGAGVSLLVNTAMSARTGSAAYYLWESFVLFGVLSAVSVAYALQRRANRATSVFWVATCLALASTTVGSGLQAAAPNRFSMLDLRAFKPSPGLDDRVAIVTGLPRPVLLENPTLALAAVVAQDIYPATVIDPFVYLGRNGANPFARGIVARIDDGYFCSIVTEQGDALGWAVKALNPPGRFVERIVSEAEPAWQGARIFVARSGSCLHR